jgi:hypothetical protein
LRRNKPLGNSGAHIEGSAKLIQKWRPWEKSTGPKTEAGKVKVSQNAFKGGAWKMLRELAKALREHQRRLNP